MLMIRLARVGARKQPHYRVVVIEKDRARNGRSVEVVGTYNPRTNPASVDLKRDRIDYWTSKGAQLSETVGKLLAKHQPVIGLILCSELRWVKVAVRFADDVSFRAAQGLTVTLVCGDIP